MESQTSKKRPWDDDSSDHSRFKRRDSTFAAPATSPTRQISPLPHAAGYYSHDSRILSQRRLPPLYTSSCSNPVGPATSISEQESTHAQHPLPLDHPRPRSQSLFNVFHNPHWQDYERHAGMYFNFIFYAPSASNRSAIRGNVGARYSSPNKSSLAQPSPFPLSYFELNR